MIFVAHPNNVSPRVTSIGLTMSALPTDPPSPCISVCVLDQRTGLCAGCFRTLDEIAAWSGYSAAEKRQVIEQLEARCARIVDGTYPTP